MTVLSKVVESANFAAAARHFDISPAMVTKHVRRLEERLGVRLLNRTTRRVSATEVGQNYYERCLRILSEVEDAERAASDLQAAPRGLLRVTSSVAFGAHQLAPAIADYLVAYPDVSVDLILEHDYLDLVKERIDLAIRHGQLSDSSLITKKLNAVNSVLCASPGYLAANGTPQWPRELVKHNCLIYTYAASAVWTFTDPNGKAEVIRISGHLLANSGDALLAFALKDTGIVLAPDYLVADELSAGRFTRLLSKYKTPATPVYAVYPHSNFLSAKTRTFIDFLAARFVQLPQMKRDGGSDGGAAPDLREVA